MTLTLSELFDLPKLRDLKGEIAERQLTALFAACEQLVRAEVQVSVEAFAGWEPEEQAVFTEARERWRAVQTVTVGAAVQGAHLDVLARADGGAAKIRAHLEDRAERLLVRAAGEGVRA